VEVNPNPTLGEVSKQHSSTWYSYNLSHYIFYILVSEEEL
jgi:hypothetical protein